MIKFYFRLPSGKVQKSFVFILLWWAFLMSLDIRDALTRSEADFDYQNEYCGRLIHYKTEGTRYRESPGLQIKMESPRALRTFDTNRDYIRSKIVKNQMKPGVPVCVYFISRDFLFASDFITQINISGTDLLSRGDVIKRYLKPVSNGRWGSLWVPLFIALLLCIGVKKVNSDK